ncbi:hypothetical protein E1B28_000072 [Marasmius oreades]|uniref:SAM domain-containing protein n=1 Tax=Marasmius oreades TaxID=181124 RepID=A0A9P8AE37_9AGAR|nr:uncharacterized protein E1B28_000072 [Marasmius oreades]KAG7098098.1 hypothetical protein E1B28_000072 [Marasmius oreades]
MQALEYEFPKGCNDSLCASGKDSSNLTIDMKLPEPNKVMRRIGSSMDCKWSGPVSPQQFLDKFLNIAVPKTKPNFTLQRKKALKAAVTGSSDLQKGFKTGHHERFSYSPLIDQLKVYCPMLKLEKTADNPETILWNNRKLTIKPDITAYNSSDSPTDGHKTDLSRAEVLFELKSKNGVDSFAKIDTGRPNSTEADNTLDQISTYAGAVFARQFRTHLFSVFIFGEHVRLIRWDRGGATFSDKFHLWENPFLLDFLWRYNYADAETRGRDPSVIPLDVTDPVGNRRATRARDILGMKEGEKVYKFTVDDEATQEKRAFYGGKVVTEAPPVSTGRSTRGFLVTTLDALDLIGSVTDWSSHIHYMKETWRVMVDALEPEWKIYQRLKDANVPHVPTILASGDAAGDWQATVTGTVVPKNHGLDIRRHHHCFIVMKEVGLPLTDFKVHKELVGAMRDALKAHQGAYERANVLHRDISVGNILIYDQGGLLIDWEFSKVVNPRISNTPRLDERTGTWQFISARILLLAGQDILHTLTDDLESFFHVLCWVAVQYVQHELSDSEVVDLLWMVYDHAIQSNGKDTGGQNKKEAMTGKKFSKVVQFQSGPLARLVKKIEAAFASWYNDTDNHTANPLTWTSEDVALHLKKEGVPEDVVANFRVGNITGPRLLELDDRSLLDTVAVTKNINRRDILDIIECLEEENAESNTRTTVAQLKNHGWMIDMFDVAFDLLKDKSSEAQRAVSRNLWDAVRAARTPEAREGKKTTRTEYVENESSKKSANKADQEAVDDADAPPKKKPRTAASCSNTACGGGSNTRTNVTGGRQDVPRKRSRSGGRLEQSRPSSNRSVNSLRRSARLRERSQNGSLSRRGSRSS